MVHSKDLIENLLIVSEKAARIARIFRQNDHLSSLLIEEKPTKGFFKDFKTLADVLVQEVVKYELSKQYPELSNSIFGEESNTFTNTNGESVTIELNEHETNTTSLLTKILEGDARTTQLLTEAVHCIVSKDDIPIDNWPTDGVEINLHDLALWIDPIDSTTEFINGNTYPSEPIPIGGLICVTVLIGIFNKSTGSPIVGVINQPFFSYENDRWRGRCFWGISVEGYRGSSIVTSEASKEKQVVAVSSMECDSVKQKLKNAGFHLVSPPGAGYKILCVLLDVLDAYVVSQGTTYFWDTCGCQAIIKTFRGNVWNYTEAMRGRFSEVKYHEKPATANDPKLFKNKDGIIVCKSEEVMRKIVQVLQ